MSALKLLPFKAKVEEAASKSQAKVEGSEAPAKKACTAYEKQLQKMDGDVSFVKDILGLNSWMVRIYSWGSQIRVAKVRVIILT